MENKLDIRKEQKEHDIVIYLSGRLDATWAGHLDDYLNDLVREGSHRLLLHMEGVPYLSSAGIRTLVNQYKKIKKIGGIFALIQLSDAVAEILNMVGMKTMLTEIVTEQQDLKKEQSQSFTIGNFRFSNEIISDQLMKVSSFGDPDLLANSGYQAIHHQKIKSAVNSYSLGIGAFGKDFEDCKNRYGEYLALGNAIVYKPTDGSKIPDYAIKTGDLEPEINALYGLMAEGVFSNKINFDPTGGNSSLALSELLTGLAKTSGFSQFVFLAIAESDGLIGVSLCTPPVAGVPLLELPGIREHVNFTTEPAYSRMLTISLGFVRSDPPEKLRPFLRPESPASSNYVHIHTAVFPFQSLPKQAADADQLIGHIFDSSIVQDVIHLLNDSREVIGLGESNFRQGVAWIGKISQ